MNNLKVYKEWYTTEKDGEISRDGGYVLYFKEGSKHRTKNFPYVIATYNKGKLSYITEYRGSTADYTVTVDPKEVTAYSVIMIFDTQEDSWCTGAYETGDIHDFVIPGFMKLESWHCYPNSTELDKETYYKPVTERLVIGLWHDLEPFMFGFFINAGNRDGDLETKVPFFYLHEQYVNAGLQQGELDFTSSDDVTSYKIFIPYEEDHTSESYIKAKIPEAKRILDVYFGKEKKD